MINRIFIYQSLNILNLVLGRAFHISVISMETTGVRLFSFRQIRFAGSKKKKKTKSQKLVPEYRKLPAIQLQCDSVDSDYFDEIVFIILAIIINKIGFERNCFNEVGCTNINLSILHQSDFT